MIKTLEIIFDKFKHNLSLLNEYVDLNSLIDALLLNGINTSTIDFLMFFQDINIKGFEYFSEHI